MSHRATDFTKRKNLSLILGWECHYCHCLLTIQTSTLDHIVPKSLGGTNHYENLVLACSPCNGKFDSQLIKCSCYRCQLALAEATIKYRKKNIWLRPSKLSKKLNYTLPTNRVLVETATGYQYKTLDNDL